MALDTTALGPTDGPDDDRSNLDRIMQSSIMALAAGEAYSDQTDTFADGTQGLTDDNVSSAGEELTGGVDGQFVTHEITTQMSQSDWDNLSQAVQNGHDVPVGLNWTADGSHELLLVSMDANNVVLRNPWGYQEDGSGDGPSRQILDNHGDIQMSRAEFASLLSGYSVPTTTALA